MQSCKWVTSHILYVCVSVSRREREKTGFSFYLESEWAGGQKVDRAGKGLLQVWKRQIQQLNRVSQDMASAILAAYPSPQLLNQVKPHTICTQRYSMFLCPHWISQLLSALWCRWQAYIRCKSEREKLSLLSDLLIRRGEGVTSTTRRVGPELSKRLFLVMTSSDPQQTLDSTLWPFYDVMHLTSDLNSGRVELDWGFKSVFFITGLQPCLWGPIWCAGFCSSSVLTHFIQLIKDFVIGWSIESDMLVWGWYTYVGPQEQVWNTLRELWSTVTFGFQCWFG